MLGFLKTLGKGLLKGIPIAGPILGGLLEGRGQGRQAEAQQGQTDDRIRAELAGLGAQRAEFERDSPVMRAQQAARGNFMQNYRSLGGRSMGQGFGQQAREAGDKLGHLGVEQLGNDTFEVPGLSERPQANAFDKILGVAAPLASIAGAFPPPPPEGLSQGLLQGQPPEEEPPVPNFGGNRFPRVRF